MLWLLLFCRRVRGVVVVFRVGGPIMCKFLAIASFELGHIRVVVDIAVAIDTYRAGGSYWLSGRGGVVRLLWRRGWLVF